MEEDQILGQTYSFSQPRSRLLRWLTDPGARASAEIRDLLLGELFNSPVTVLLAAGNGLMLNIFAYFMSRSWVYLALIAADAGVSAIRVMLTYRSFAAAREGRPTPTDLYCHSAIGWCFLNGLTVMVSVASNISAVQADSVGTAVALLCLTCSRNYAAPRYAIVLCMVGLIPFLLGIGLVWNHWLWIFLVEAPILLLAVLAILFRFQTLTISRLQFRFESERKARYDLLTNLFNRAGFGQAVEALLAAAPRQFTLFYLDLDGFKAVNDMFGHAAGDRLLADVAARLRKTTRDGDVLARFGGDEFVILIPELGPELAPGLAESLIRRLSDAAYPQPDGGGGAHWRERWVCVLSGRRHGAEAVAAWCRSGAV